MEAVSIPFHPQFIDEDVGMKANDLMEQAATAMLDELAITEAVLRRRSAANRAAA